MRQVPASETHMSMCRGYKSVAGHFNLGPLSGLRCSYHAVDLVLSPTLICLRLLNLADTITVPRVVEDTEVVPCATRNNL